MSNWNGLNQQGREFRIEHKGDYLHFICADCEKVCSVDFLGRDPSIPKIRITCSNRKSHTSTLKIWYAGIGWQVGTEKSSEVERRKRALRRKIQKSSH